MSSPLLTRDVYDAFRAAINTNVERISCSLDLNRSVTAVTVKSDEWIWQGQCYPYPDVCKERMVCASRGWRGDCRCPRCLRP